MRTDCYMQVSPHPDAPAESDEPATHAPHATTPKKEKRPLKAYNTGANVSEDAASSIDHTGEKRPEPTAADDVTNATLSLKVTIKNQKIATTSNVPARVGSLANMTTESGQLGVGNVGSMGERDMVRAGRVGRSRAELLAIESEYTASKQSQGRITAEMKTAARGLACLANWYAMLWYCV